MYLARSIKILASVPFLFFIACSQNNNSLSITEQGVATGAVIGAGVGALVGSTAGEAGAGVVLGSVAGATSGGIIGSSIEGQSERIDAHDKAQGINTRKRASRRSNTQTAKNEIQNDTPSEGSFLGKYLWDRAPEETEALAGNTSSRPKIQLSQITNTSSRVKQASTTSNNLPSGSRGVASKYAQIKAPTLEIKELPLANREIENRVVELPKARAQLNTPTPIKKTPTIDLIKPKENLELPKAKTELPPSPVKEKFAKKQVLTPSLPKVEEKQTEKTKEIIKNEVEVAKAVEPKIKVESNETKCAKGEKEIQRAKNSPSDSDKVFYLRRAILMCPEEASLKVELGKVYGRLGLKDDARREFTNALENDPANETAQEELSIMMLEGSKK